MWPVISSKSASDLGVPVVGVGLLYQQGYFRQVIDKDGGQQALFPYNDPGQLPITPLRKPNGEWLRLEIDLPGYSVWLRAWQVQVGRVKLYLLDSNDAANFPAHRGITSELYGGGPELRLKQELLLGIGGWRLLKELDIQPEVCHLNEGHAALAVLERARSLWKRPGSPLKSHWPSHGRVTSLPPTRRWLPVLTVFLLPSSSSTSVGTPRTSSAYLFTICWPLVEPIRMTLLNPSIWPIWQCEEAGR